jgi:hypothetical protein
MHPDGRLEAASPNLTHPRTWREFLFRRACIPTILAFFSHKILRSGPRLLLQLAVCLCFVFLLIQILPLCGVDVPLRGSYGRVLTWTGDGEGEDGGDGLRIVVFGSNDAAIPPTDGSLQGNMRSWPELLCVEVSAF